MDLNSMKESIVLIALVILISAAAAIGIDDYRTSLEGDLPTTSVTEEKQSLPGTGTVINLDNDDIEVTTVAEVVVQYNSSDNRTMDETTEWNLTNGFLNQVNTSLGTNDTYVNYTYRDSTVAYNVTERGLIAGDNATDFMDTIGTIIGIAVLIGIVILAFTFGRR